MNRVFIYLPLALTLAARSSVAWEVRSYAEALESARHTCGYAVDVKVGDPNTPGICRNCQGGYLVLGATDGTARGQNECASAKAAFSANSQVRHVCVSSDYLGSILGVGIPASDDAGYFDGAYANAVFACCQTMGYGTDFDTCARSACNVGAQGSVCFLR
jgi:hypothetical protein